MTLTWMAAEGNPYFVLDDTEEREMCGVAGDDLGKAATSLSWGSLLLHGVVMWLVSFAGGYGKVHG